MNEKIKGNLAVMGEKFDGFQRTGVYNEEEQNKIEKKREVDEEFVVGSGTANFEILNKEHIK